MTTLSEVLLIKIGFDIPNLKKNVNEVKKEVSKGDEVANKLIKTFQNAQVGAKNFFTTLAGTAGVTAFISKVADMDSALNRLSKTTGMSVENISAWSNAAEHMGGSASEMQAGIAGISKEMTKFKYTGDSTLVPFLNQMGVNILDNNGKMKDQTQIMLELADQAQKMPKEDFSNLASMNGFNQSQINLMLQGRKALEAQVKEQNKNNLVTKQQAEEAQKAEMAWVDLKQSFMGVARTVAYILIPPLIGVAKVLTALFTFMGNHKETLGVLFLFAIPKLLAFNKGFLILLRAMTGITPVLKIATFAMRGFGLSTMIALAPLLLIGTGLALLLDDFLTFQAGGDSWIPWGSIFGGAKEAIKDIKDLIMSLGGFKDSMEAIARGDWKTVKENAQNAIQATGEKMRGVGQTISQGVENTAEKIGGAIATGLGNGMVGSSALKGLKIKSGEAIAGGGVRGYTADFARIFQETNGDNIKYFSAFNDKSHQGRGSRHNQGQAFDVALKNASAGERAKIIASLKQNADKHGFNIKILDEYAHPSAHATGGHIHVSVLGRKGMAAGKTAMVSAGQVLFGNKGGNHAYDDIILAAANQQGIPPNILKGLIHQESQFNPHARSRTNAKGIAQFTTIALKDQRQRGYNINPDDPVQSIHGAARILRDNYKRFGDWTPAIAAYNAGAGAVASNGNRPLTDTKEHREYARKVLNFAKNETFANSQSIAEGTGQVPFVTPPVGAKAHHALKHGGGTTHNTINSNTSIHTVNILADKAEHAGKAFLHEMQKARELKNPWWKAAMANNTAMQ